MVNQYYDQAIFQDLGSAPATMEAAKIADFYGCGPGNCVETADAEQAYVQAEMKGTLTWVALPEEQWPAWWRKKGFNRPVCPLKKALYGHPDSGTFWEDRVNEHVLSIGFTPIGPE